jgi:hypothetical protein
MRIRTMLTTTALTVLSFTVASDSRAEHRTFGTTELGWPQQGRMTQVQRLARELEQAATRVHRDALAQAHHRTSREAQALYRLGRLENAAQSFRDEVRGPYRNPRDSRVAFRSLVRAYNRAAEALDGLHGHGNVYAGFNRVESLLAELSDSYRNRAGNRYDRGGSPWGDDDRDHPNRR